MDRPCWSVAWALLAAPPEYVLQVDDSSGGTLLVALFIQWGSLAATAIALLLFAIIGLARRIFGKPTATNGRIT
jgi:hypothetical protein